MNEKSKTDAMRDPAAMVENAFLMGIGVLELTRAKVTEFADELIERGKMSSSEAKQVSDRLGTIAEEQQAAVTKTVVAETNRVLKATGIATKKDVDALKTEIKELKAMIAAAMPAGGAKG